MNATDLPSSGASPAALERLHKEIRSCSRCVAAGLIPQAAPVVAGNTDNRIMLIGQAPGIVEVERRLPFQGRSGGVLIQWMLRAGFTSADQVRRHVYMTSITKCFPGRNKGGGGDRRPSPAEIALCSPYLDRQLALIKPEVLILLGGLAQARFLPVRLLVNLVGETFTVEGRVMVPLPHPSGASRWLNDPNHRALLDRGLARLATILRPYLDALKVDE